MQVLEDIVLYETSILMSVQSSTCFKRFTFSFRANFIECVDQLYFSKFVHVSHLQFVVSSIWGGAVEEGSWKSRKSLACAFPGAPLLQALGSDSALRVCPSPLLPSCKRSLSCERQGCVSCERTGGAQRRGCRRKFTTALRAVSVGYWKWFEHQMQYWKCCSKRSG